MGCLRSMYVNSSLLLGTRADLPFPHLLPPAIQPLWLSMCLISPQLLTLIYHDGSPLSRLECAPIDSHYSSTRNPHHIDTRLYSSRPVSTFCSSSSTPTASSTSLTFGIKPRPRSTALRPNLACSTLNKTSPSRRGTARPTPLKTPCFPNKPSSSCVRSSSTLRSRNRVGSPRRTLPRGSRTTSFGN
jgi:hypothetical protein